ncbi:MAG: hypothetical protein ACFFG0_40605 [Candidatus Thorarchaeota archaeon]
MVDKIDPEVLIPVHTEKPEWYQERYADITRLLEKGEKLNL